MSTTTQQKEAAMQNHLEQLLKLQIIDYDLGELDRSKEYLPDMMDNLNKEIIEARERLETATRLLEEAKIRHKHLELEVSAKEAELEKYQKQMMTIKTNKEYDALVAEIDAVKSVISEKETELLQTMEQLSELEEKMPELKQQLDRVEENDSRQLKILQEKIDTIGEKVSSKEAERRAITTSIPRQTLSLYERVRRGKGGAVVVVVRKRSCSACHNALTPQKVQEIRRGDRIHTCDACGRLLYWDNDLSD
ncbi:MAG: C4-type zinc ribbon domain-containing protein [Candidatus Zixiibacteriota bacterium]